MAKAEHARLGTELQKLIAEEGLLNQEIANEQTRWTDLNQRIGGARTLPDPPVNPVG